jgi:predicted O-methyltransferase YrrM
MTRALSFLRKYFRALLGAMWLFTVGWSRRVDRRVLDALAAEVGPGARPPTIGVWELVDREARVELRELVAVNGNTSLQELAVLASLVALRAPKRIFEIGTFDGRSTINLAINSTAETEVLTLDLPNHMARDTALRTDPLDTQYIDKASSGARYQKTDVAARIVQLWGDSATFDFGPYRGTIDFVFVDGSHSYEYILNDSRRAVELLRDGRGVVIWHDYGIWPGVTRALNQLYREDPGFAGLKHIIDTSFGYMSVG